MTLITATEVLVLLLEFFEGSGLYALIGMLAYYTKNLMNFGKRAIPVIHWFLAMYCSGIAFVPLIYSTKFGLYWTILVISTFGCLVSSLLYVQYYFMILPKIGSVSFINQQFMYVACVTLYGLTSGGKAGCIYGILHHGIPQQSEDDERRQKFLPFYFMFVHYMGMFLGYFPFVIQLDQHNEIDFHKLFWVMIASNVVGAVILRLGRKKLHFNEIKTSSLAHFMKISCAALKSMIRSNPNKAKVSQYTQNDTAKLKLVYRILPLYIPVIVLIAMKEQKYSRFPTQSEAMKNEIGRNVVHPTFILSLSPLITCIILPIFVYIAGYFTRKYGRPLGVTRRSLAMFVFAVLAYAAAIVVECKVENYRRPYIKEGSGHLLIYNTCNCPASLGISGHRSLMFVSPFNYTTIILEQLGEKSEREVTLVITCNTHRYRTSYEVTFWPNEVVSYAIVIDFYHQLQTHWKDNTARGLVELSKIDFYMCSVTSPKVRIISDTAYAVKIEFRSVNYKRNYTFNVKPGEFDVSVFCLVQDEFTLWINDILMRYDVFGSCGEFILLLSYRDQAKLPEVKILEVVPSNEVSILYQIPQFLLVDLVELFIRAPGFVYAETKVPPEWYGLLFNFWYASEALGNLACSMSTLIIGIDRQLFAFLLWYGLGMLSLIGVSEFLLKYYKTDYDELAEKRGIIK